jgi:ATF/CREB family transcription factor
LLYSSQPHRPVVALFSFDFNPLHRSSNSALDTKPITTAEGKENTAQPLGPPPRPPQQNGGDGDYFNQVHNPNNPSYQAEPNPFEAQFGNPSSETPGKLLPSVAALTSPSSLLPADTPGWNSLRSGPLSPAMLTGPAGGDYFDTSYSRPFPTPNESGLRTGLTPGGGGSMFPAPSPNSQAIFNNLQLGAPTPNTLDFLRTGVNARTATNGIAPTSQPSDAPSTQGMELKLPTDQAPSDNFAQHDADAANGLYMLAQSNGSRSGNSFTVSSQPTGAVQPPGTQSDNQAPTRSQKNSLGSSTLNAEDSSDSDESEEAVKPATRSRGKRQPEPKSNNRRKATDTPARTPASKRQKGNAAEKAESPEEASPTHHKDGKKMTDEEKRKNFLERNR